jgi:hypothetical protein
MLTTGARCARLSPRSRPSQFLAVHGPARNRSTRSTPTPRPKAPTAPWEARARIFEQRYPGIKVSITGGFSNVLNARVNQQLAANKLELDAAIFQTLQDFVRWKAQSHLLNYKPIGFDLIATASKTRTAPSMACS